MDNENIFILRVKLCILKVKTRLQLLDVTMANKQNEITETISQTTDSIRPIQKN